MKYFFFILTTSLMILSFQNCGEGFDYRSEFSEQDTSIPDGYVLIEDMIVDKEMLVSQTLDGDKPVSLATDSSDVLQQGLKEIKTRLWPNGDLYYKFESSVTNKQKRRFREACRQISAFAPVRCIEAGSGRKVFLLVRTLKNEDTPFCGQGHIGFKKEQGVMSLRMNETCWELPQIVEHELMHCFGISHEHIRPDAVDHIVNLDPDGLGGYTGTVGYTIDSSLVDYMTQAYDYSSIMHYNSYLYGKKTLWKKDFALSDPNGEVKYQNYMSLTDHRTLYNLYKNSTNSKTWPTWNSVSQYISDNPVTFEVNCRSGSKNRLACVSLTGPIVDYQVLSASQCANHSKIGMKGSNTIWVEKGCNAKIRVKTKARFANSFQIEGVFKYTQKSVLKKY